MIFDDFLALIRQAAPYIHAHRNKTFVIHYDTDCESNKLKEMLHDCALLQSLGINLVLVNGIRQAVDQNLAAAGIESEFYNNKRVTTSEVLPHVLNAAGSLSLKIEAMLSMGMINSPMQDAAVRVTSGNFITAKPVGIIDGKDFCYTGNVRKINVESIKRHLDNGEIVSVAPIGYALNGDTYNLSSEEVASEIAVALQADKLIYVCKGVKDYINSGRQRQLTPNEAQKVDIEDLWLKKSLFSASEACSNGIRRIHIIEKDERGGLLLELFTRDGTGVMVTSDQYDRIRPASLDDINGLLALIKPLEEKGILVSRSREKLMNEINHFYLLTRDSTIIACAALYVHENEKTAEVACLAVDPSYRQHRRADFLLKELEKIAKAKGVRSLFILTTQTTQWFEERGFLPIKVEDLPERKRATYNTQRKSRPYRKSIV